MCRANRRQRLSGNKTSLISTSYTILNQFALSAKVLKNFALNRFADQATWTKFGQNLDSKPAL